jgi:hypothetical protein
MSIAKYLGRLAQGLTSQGVLGPSKGGTGVTAPGTVGNRLVSNGTDWVSQATRIVTITDATSVTINADTTDVALQTNTQATGTLTINAITGTPVNGQKIIFRLKSTNVQTFSWNAAFQGSVDLVLPTVSTGTDKFDYFGFMYSSGTSKWHLIAKNFGY